MLQLVKVRLILFDLYIIAIIISVSLDTADRFMNQ